MHEMKSAFPSIGKHPNIMAGTFPTKKVEADVTVKINTFKVVHGSLSLLFLVLASQVKWQDDRYSVLVHRTNTMVELCARTSV